MPSLANLSQRIVQVGFIIAAGLAWHWAVTNHHVSPLILPPLPAVWRNFSKIILSGAIWPDLSVTLYELVCAFTIAALAGGLVGYLVSRSGFLVKVFDPLLSSMYSIPAILLAIAVVQGYAFAWVGHFFFERNRPATFKYPVFSLMGDWRMWWEILIGRRPF